MNRPHHDYNRDMPIANNVTRMLDKLQLRYSTFELPPTKLGALETAELLKVAPESVLKTIVVLTDQPRKALLVLVPAPRVVDLKKVAVAIGQKKVWLPSEREAESITGLRAGGISPLALLNRGFRVLLDSTAASMREVHVSAGRRGLNIRMSVDDLVELTGARLASLSAPSAPDDSLQDGGTFR